jgi:hypothetical protein
VRIQSERGVGAEQVLEPLFISFAALFVNVIARISFGLTPHA